MTTYVLAAALAGAVGFIFGLLTYGAAVWQVFAWYLAGGWTGFGVVLAAMFGMGTLNRRRARS